MHRRLVERGETPVEVSWVRGANELKIWINGSDGMCLARWSYATGFQDIHLDTEGQMREGRSCLDCQSAGVSYSGFRNNVAQHLGVNLPDDMASWEDN